MASERANISNEGLEGTEDTLVKEPYFAHVDWVGALSYALTQSRIPFIYNIVIANGTEETLQDIEIRIDFEFDFLEPYRHKIASLDGGMLLEHTPTMRIYAKKLFEITETLTDTMTIHIEDGLGHVFMHEVFPLPILPMNQWTGTRVFAESIANFVLPNVPMITQLQGRAAQILKDISGDSAFTGYMQQDKGVVRKQLAAIYATIYEQQISYALPPTSLEILGQRIRLPHEVLSGKVGTCIEMSILFCSLCEAFGLHSFIVFIEGHAFAGAWLVESAFDRNVIQDLTELTKRLADGINEVEILEATYLNGGSGKSFEQATRKARAHLEDPEQFEMIVDVYRSHRVGIRPMPIQIVENGELRILDYGLADDADAMAKVSKTLEEHFLDTSKLDEVDKSTIWMRNLLDLSKRNALISFRGGSKSIQLFASNLGKLEDALSKGEAFTLREVVSDWRGSGKGVDFADIESQEEFIEKLSEVEFKSRRLRTFLSKEMLEKTVKAIYREAKKSLEENGSNTLYLALGFLRWWDPADPKDADGNTPLRYAPLVLLPIDLTRKSQGSYLVTLRDEDAQMNITLLEMLRQNFDLRIGQLNPLPLDEYGVDFPLVMNSMRKAIMDKDGWDVVEVASIGLFSFSQFVMWNDLRTRFNELTKNKVVNALVEGLYTDYPDEIPVSALDDAVKVSDIVIPSSVDSSQLAAMIEATRGSSFVLHGPPGTGKSQTITNMIANAIYQQKTVIFVAEKMAALDVVKLRLESIGLGDFCLELHSNKTQKKVLLDKLEHSLSLRPLREDTSFERKAEQIQIVKDRLNSTITELHTLREHGRSIYDLINLYLQQGKTNRSFRFSELQLSSLTQVSWSQWESELRSLNRSLIQLETPYYEHPLRDWKKNGYALHSGDLALSLIDGALLLSSQIKDEIHTLEDEHPEISSTLLKVSTMTQLATLDDVMRARNLKVVLDERAFSKLFDVDVISAMEQIIQKANAYQGIREALLVKYGSSIDNYDYVTGKRQFLEASSGFLRKGSKQRASLQDLNSRTRDGFSVNAENALLEFDAISKEREERDSLMQLIDRFMKDFGVAINVYPDDIDPIEDLSALSAVLIDMKKAEKSTTTELFELYNISHSHILRSKVDVVGLIQKYRNLNQNLLELELLTGADMNALLQNEQWLDILSERLKDWKEHLPSWKSWSAFYANMDSLKELGLDNVIDGLYHSELTNRDDVLIRTFYADLARDLITYHLSKSETLSKFNGLSFESQIEEYNHLIDDFERISQEQIRIKLSQNLPDVKNATKDEQKQLANLQRIIRSKGRGASIRSIFQESGLVIRRMTPVLLMSPLSVAQYIDPSLPPFDLVIFDEASQIRTSVAIGAMSRAKDCIIVGDPNQMPPTSFFSTQTIDEENLQIESLESLLEDCLAINLPQRYLSWHYRSQSESLITFSNQMYYGGKMRTFPSPFDRLSKVKFEKIDGTYDRGGTRTNLMEAQAVVADLVHRLKDKNLVKNSIGVVTFNIQQQNLIDDLFQECIRKDNELAKIYEELPESVFIKNLENVQGDERDVIIFSICYGPDQEGKISLNFGPLNRKGGWRRLNVAVSRARKEMHIYSSIEPQDITVKPTSSDGLIGIRRFLEFAQIGFFMDSTKHHSVENGVDEAMQLEIASFLEQHGYETQINVGASGMRLDIGVIDPRDYSKYLAAIRLDGHQYSTADTARDRNRLMPSVLKVRGWSVYSLWTLDWYDNPEREQKRLLKYLEALNGGWRPTTHSDTNEENQVESKASNHKLDIESGAAIKGGEESQSIDNFVPTEVHSGLAKGTSNMEASNSDILLPDLQHDVHLQTVDTDDDSDSLNMKVASPAVNRKDGTVEVKAALEEIGMPSLHAKLESSGAKEICVDKPEVEVQTDRPKSCTYEKYSVEEMSQEVLRENPQRMIRLMEDIIAFEGPIRDLDLFYRVLEGFSGMRLSKNTQQQLQVYLSKAKKKSTAQGEVTFLWEKGFEPNTYFTYRLPKLGDKRELDGISDYELANLLWDIVLKHSEKQGNEEDIDEETLIRTATKLLGYSRYTEKMYTLMKTAVTNAIRRKLLKRDRKNIVLVE